MARHATFLAGGLLLVLAPGAAAQAPSEPEDAWTGTWSTVRTPSVLVYHEASHPVAAARLNALEDAVGRLGAELGLGPQQLAGLRRDPIEYLYVHDPRQLGRFGVDDVDGLALVAERRILAARLPHEHELVHVLAHLSIAPAPTGNQPWLQEGLASYLGGHLGEAPAAVLATGDQVLDRSPGLIPALMTVEGFRGSPLPAEACYAASARFVQFLDREYGGRARLLELLRLLAGHDEEVAQRPASIVETQLEGVYATPFHEIVSALHRWRRENPPSGIVQGPAPKGAPDLVFSDEDHELRWWIEEAGWVLQADASGGDVDLALSWGGSASTVGEWSAPPRARGFELRLDDAGGSLLAHEQPAVLLRWHASGELVPVVGSRSWFLPAAAVEGVAPPRGPEDAVLWSQPRFRVD